ncbi:helix-turn-helix domain-containing protein [Planosporangium sp. 12N6]|uniref:helix-turn-helix domain-containing protein n=1 Tax=Planosporangium spinosum TaxID=3402278 RepID=UPI003CEDBB4C
MSSNRWRRSEHVAYRQSTAGAEADVGWSAARSSPWEPTVPSRPRAAVDPRFPAELRHLRLVRGLSLRALAGLVYQGKSLIHELETGRAQPAVDLAGRLDTALEAGGALARLVQPGPETSAEDEARLAYVARCPRRVDSTAIDALAALLVGYRRLEDSIGAVAVLPSVASQLALVTDMVGEARDPLRPRLVDVAAQWAQFAGWLHIADAEPAAARTWLAQALEWATETGNSDLIGTVLSFRGYLAEELGAWGPMIGLTRVSLRDPFVFVGQRAYDQFQLARGLARVGDRTGAADALAAGHDLALATTAHSDPVPPWHYYRSPAFFALEGGVVHSVLAHDHAGHGEQAARLLTTGLEGLPAESQSADWAGVYLCHLAAAYARIGDAQAAEETLARVRAIADSTRSPRLAARVPAVARRMRLSADT